MSLFFYIKSVHFGLKRNTDDYPGSLWNLTSKLTVMFTLWHEGIHYSEYNFRNPNNCFNTPRPTGPHCTPSGLDVGDWAEVCVLGFDLSHPYNWEQWWRGTYNCIQQAGGDVSLQDAASARRFYSNLVRNGLQPSENSFNATGYTKAGHAFQNASKKIGEGIQKSAKAIGNLCKKLFSSKRYTWTKS